MEKRSEIEFSSSACRLKTPCLAFYDVINNMYTTDVINFFKLIFFLDISKIQTRNLGFSRLFVEKQKKLGLSFFVNDYQLILHSGFVWKVESNFIFGENEGSFKETVVLYSVASYVTTYMYKNREAACFWRHLQLYWKGKG